MMNETFPLYRLTLPCQALPLQRQSVHSWEHFQFESGLSRATKLLLSERNVIDFNQNNQSDSIDLIRIGNHRETYARQRNESKRKLQL